MQRIVNDIDIYVLWGKEFQRRVGGAFPLQYRPIGGCRHDWKVVRFDDPLVVAFEEAVEAGKDQA